MDTNSDDITLFELETIERNLRTDGDEAGAEKDEAPHVSAVAFLIP